MSNINGIKKSETYETPGAADPFRNPSSGEEVSGDIGSNDAFGIDSSDRDLGALESNGSLSALELYQKLNSLLKNLSPEEKTQYQAQINALKKEISALGSSSMAPVQLVETFSAIQGEIMGSDSLGGEGSDQDGTVTQQVKALKGQIEKNPQLDDATKKLLSDKLDDVVTIESINAEQAQEKLDGVREEIHNYTLYSPAAMRLSKELSLEDPAAVQEMLDKHGIDGKSPTLDPAKLEALLNDPMIADVVSEAQETHNTAFKTMVDMVGKKSTEAHAVNAATDLKDTSADVDTDTSSFQWLYETKIGTSQEAKEVLKSGTALAEKKAKILSALTNTKIEANPKAPGMITLPTGDFNAVANKPGGPAIEWPSIEAVSFHADFEGDGQTAIPEWMKQAHYPLHSIDGGGWNPLGLVGVAAGAVLLGPYIGGASAIGVGVTGGFAGDLTSYEPEKPY